MKSRLLTDRAWNERENARLRPEIEAQGALPAEPQSDGSDQTISAADIMAEREWDRISAQLVGTDSTLRRHQGSKPPSSSRQKKRKPSPKRLLRTWGAEIVVLVGDDEDSHLTEKPCDYGMHPIFADFLERSGLRLRDLLLFMRYAPLYGGEHTEWTAEMAALRKEDRVRAAGESGSSRKYGGEGAVWRQERLPRGCVRFLGIDISSASSLSVVANLACSLYVWYLTRLLRGLSWDPEISLENTRSITSSPRELTQLAILLRDKEPAAQVLSIVGARTYQKSDPGSLVDVVAAGRHLFGDAVDAIAEEDIDRSGFAHLGRMLSAIREAGFHVVNEDKESR